MQQGGARSRFSQPSSTAAQLISQNLLAALILLINHSTFSTNRLYQHSLEPLQSLYSLLEPGFSWTRPFEVARPMSGLHWHLKNRPMTHITQATNLDGCSRGQIPSAIFTGELNIASAGRSHFSKGSGDPHPRSSSPNRFRHKATRPRILLRRHPRCPRKDSAVQWGEAERDPRMRALRQKGLTARATGPS